MRKVKVKVKYTLVEALKFCAAEGE